MRRDRRLANLRQLRHAAPVVEVTVDELVLHGFQPAERHAIGDAFQLELERAFAGADFRSGFRQDAELPGLDAGRISLPAQARPASVGAQAARAVFGGLNAVGIEEKP
jgi:hypothetical protein